MIETFTAGFVVLDPALQGLIVVGITFVVSYILLQLSNVPALQWLALYLGQYKVGIITWLTGLVANLVQNLLNQIPVTWESVAVLVMQLIVAVVVALTGFAAIRRYNVKGHAALR